VIGLYRALWRYAAGRRRALVAALLLLAGAQVIKLAIPWLAARALNALQLSGMAGLHQAAWSLALIVVAAAASWVLHGPGRVIERGVAIHVRSRFTDTLYARLAALPLAWHERHHSGETLHRVDRSSRALFDFAQHQFVYLHNIVNLVGPVVAIVLVSSLTGAAALLGYLLVAFLVIRFDRTTLRVAGAENRAERRYAAALADCLGNIATVLTLRLQEPTRALLAERLADLAAPFRRNAALTETKWCVVDLLNHGLRVGLVLLYGWLAWRQDGTVLIGSAVMVFQYAQQAGGVISATANHYHEMVGHQAAFADAATILAETVAPRRIPAPLPVGWRTIGVADLAFAYPVRRQEAAGLADIALTLTRGRRIALVGESGAGKSTLMRVLAGLHPAASARYAVDGVARPDLADLGAFATLLPQEPELFESSFRHNITLGLPYDEAAVAWACDIAQLAPLLAESPAGLETPIAERGANLSGGQRQRLALARGLLAARDSALIMLDEPTSSVDPATEAAIFDGIFAAFADRCLVSSVHRLTLLPRFDEIVLLARGRVVDVGPLEDLLARQPAFRALWQRAAAASAA
jgi:ABC-type multidrug transport system fused ATPase/permease subunit